MTDMHVFTRGKSEKSPLTRVEFRRIRDGAPAEATAILVQ